MFNKRGLSSYSKLDRALHRMAFASGGLQEAVADIEDRMHRRELARIPLQRPVFITALPRAGTTMLLNLLRNTGEFVTHTDQSMPFVLCPLTWKRLSGALRTRDNNQMESAYTEGADLSTQNAETYEEVLWQQFWGHHYQKDHILPWADQHHPEFARFFENHLRKQLLLNQNGNEQRYMSKNTMNIARIPLLRRLYPDAKIIVPFRDPVQQAASLLRQHQRVLKMHRDDPFSLRYMKGIGHYDFGENLLPINFSGWVQQDRRKEANELNFWLEYWAHTYEHVLSLESEQVSLLPFDRCIEQPQAGLAYIAHTVSLSHPQNFARQTDKIRPFKPRVIDTTDVAPNFLMRCQDIFGRLNQRAALKA